MTSTDPIIKPIEYYSMNKIGQPLWEWKEQISIFDSKKIYLESEFDPILSLSCSFSRLDIGHCLLKSRSLDTVQATASCCSLWRSATNCCDLPNCVFTQLWTTFFTHKHSDSEIQRDSNRDSLIESGIHNFAELLFHCSQRLFYTPIQKRRERPLH